VVDDVQSELLQRFYLYTFTTLPIHIQWVLLCWDGFCHVDTCDVSRNHAYRLQWLSRQFCSHNQSSVHHNLT